MNWSAIQPIWPVMVVIVYILGYCMMRMMSEKLYQSIRLHNRICEARQMRRSYFEDMMEED